MVIQSDSSSVGQNKDFQPTFCTSVLLTCAVILVNYDSIASKYLNTFPSSSIPSKGKFLYKFSARSEKTVYLNVLKCNASLSNLFYSWEYSGWFIKPLILINQLSVCVGGKPLFLNGCPLLQEREGSVALPWQGHAVSHCCRSVSLLSSCLADMGKGNKCPSSPKVPGPLAGGGSAPGTQVLALFPGF